MTFSALLNDVYRRLDKYPVLTLAAPDQAQDRIKRFMNDRYRELMRIDGVGADLRDETYIVTATANKPRMALPSGLTTISSVIDTRNRVRLQERTLAWIRGQDASNPAQVTGTPWAYAVLNETGVVAQPTSDISIVQILSSVIGDNRPWTVEILDGRGVFTVVSGVLNGTTPVGIPTAWGFSKILRVSVQAVPTAAVASVTVRETVPVAQTLAVLGQGSATVAPLMAQMSLLSWVLHLWPTPSSAIPYSIDFARPVYDLVEDTDEPALPQDFHTLLVWGACEDECLKMDDDRAGYFRGKWETDLKALRAWLHRARGARWVPNARSARWSDLGPYFPPERW